MRPRMPMPLGAPLRRLRRSVGSQRAIDNAASQLTEHQAVFAEIDDLARRLDPPAEEAARLDAPHHAA